MKGRGGVVLLAVAAVALLGLAAVTGVFDEGGCARDSASGAREVGRRWP